MGPNDPTKGSDYIKRVIGLPGDEVTYRGRTLYVNGMQVATLPDGSYSGTTRSKDYVNYTRVTEKLPELDHEILLGPPPGFAGGPEGSWRVSEGHFLVMGDNRSNSLDRPGLGPRSRGHPGRQGLRDLDELGLQGRRRRLRPPRDCDQIAWSGQPRPVADTPEALCGT